MNQWGHIWTRPGMQLKNSSFLSTIHNILSGAIGVDETGNRLAVIYSAPGEIRVWISGHDENRTPAPHQYHGTFST